MNASARSLDLIFKEPGSLEMVRIADGAQQWAALMGAGLMLWLENETIHCTCRHFPFKKQS